MSWLAAQDIAVLPLVEAVEALATRELRAPTIAISFDDGYRNNINVALPILERYGFPATIFLTTGLVGSDRAMWHSRLLLALERTSVPNLARDGWVLPLDRARDRTAAAWRLQVAIKETSGQDFGHAVSAIEAELKVPVDPRVERDSSFAMMDEADITNGLKSGLIEFGAHTVTHPLLSRLDDETVAREVGGSCGAVEVMTGQPCRCFAYPNGRPEDYDDRTVRRLKARGVRAAVTTDEGTNRYDCDPLRLMRLAVGASLPKAGFGAKVLDLPGWKQLMAVRRHLSRLRR